MPNEQGHIGRLAILCGTTFVGINILFFFLSGGYFDSHHQIVGGASVPTFSPDQAMHVRGVFAAVSAVIAVTSFLAGLWRRAVGHLLPAVLALGSLVGSVQAFRHDLPGVLVVVQGLIGVLMPILAWSSYQRRSRRAWAFLVAMCGVLAVANLFGAPRLRQVFDVSLWTTMLIPGLFAVAAVALALLRDDYLDRTSARA